MIDPLDVRDLVGHPGTHREVKAAGSLEGLSIPLAEVPAGRDLDLRILLESVVEGILVSGTVAAKADLKCARCLTEFEGELLVNVQELFEPGTPADADADDDTYRFDEGSLDLEPMVRDAVVLNLPFAPNCREDCLGLCSRCGGDRNLGECTCGPEIDPRWAALERLLEQ